MYLTRIRGCSPETSNVWEYGAASIEVYSHGCILCCHNSCLHVLQIGDDGGKIGHEDFGGFDTVWREIGRFHQGGQLDGLVFGKGDGALEFGGVVWVVDCELLDCVTRLLKREGERHTIFIDSIDRCSPVVK